MTIAFGGDAVPEVELRHRLRIAREFAGLEQEELAQKMGVSRNTITNYEKGKVAPRKIVLNAWAWHCGVSLDWINTGRPGAPSPPGGGAPVAPIPGDESPLTGSNRRPLAYLVPGLPVPPDSDDAAKPAAA